MIVQWFIVVLLIPLSQPRCVKNKIKLWSPTKCEAGKTFFAQLNTIHGFKHVQQPYLYPWLADLKIALPGLVKSCTGALINDRYVLTAQICILPPINPHQVTVHVGFFNGYDKDVSEIFQPRILERKAAYFVLYPDYNPRNPQTFANNLALIKLEEPVSYSKTIYPIQLPAVGDQFKNYTDEQVDNVEWSYFPNFGGPDDKKLKENVARILSAEQCSTTDNNYEQIVKPGVLCTVDSGDENRPCGEEHGGLLTITTFRHTCNVTELIGITSWEPSGGSCETAAPPRVYVRIDNRLLWIKDNTKDGSYCRY